MGGGWEDKLGLLSNGLPILSELIEYCELEYFLEFFYLLYLGFISSCNIPAVLSNY